MHLMHKTVEKVPKLQPVLQYYYIFTNANTTGGLGPPWAPQYGIGIQLLLAGYVLGNRLFTMTCSLLTVPFTDG